MTEKIKIAIVGNVSQEKIDLMRMAYPEASFVRFDKAEDVPQGKSYLEFIFDEADEAQNIPEETLKEIQNEAAFTNRPPNRRERRIAAKKAKRREKLNHERN